MADQSQCFYQAIAQPPKNAGGAVGKGKAEAESKDAVDQKPKSPQCC